MFSALNSKKFFNLNSIFYKCINQKTLHTVGQGNIALSQAIRGSLTPYPLANSPLCQLFDPSHMQLKMHAKTKKGQMEGPRNPRMNEVEDMNGNGRNRITLI